MSAYYMNEAAFDLPAGFVDRTVTHLEATTDDGGEVALLVERHPIGPDETLSNAVARRMTEARKETRGLTVLSERQIRVGDQPAIEVVSRWRDDDDIAYTRAVHWMAGTTLLIVAGESSFQEREICDRVVEHVIGSIRPIH